MREDLPNGALAAHILHAAGESGPAPPGSIAVALSVPNETELLRAAARLDARGIAYVLIHENAGPYQNQATAIGIRPTHDRKTVGKAISHLPLVK